MRKIAKKIIKKTAPKRGGAKKKPAKKGGCNCGK